MNVPPAVVDVRVAQAGGRRLHLWLPVFVLWPLLVVVGVVVLGVAAVADAVLLALDRPHRFTAFVWGCFTALGEMRGTEVAIDNAGHNVGVSVR
jgi:hypothetical protein